MSNIIYIMNVECGIKLPIFFSLTNSIGNLALTMHFLLHEIQLFNKYGF